MSLGMPPRTCLCMSRWPILLVCPASVLTNWHRELTQWGSFSVAKLHGSTGNVALAEAQEGSVEIVLTTFDKYRCGVVQGAGLGSLVEIMLLIFLIAQHMAVRK